MGRPLQIENKRVGVERDTYEHVVGVGAFDIVHDGVSVIGGSFKNACFTRTASSALARRQHAGTSVGDGVKNRPDPVLRTR
ncbi:MAG: hypothetical protein QOJ61_2437 [Mycobacterium sp.]|nr:hypothetical protein [Mycobacterium sp.]